MHNKLLETFLAIVEYGSFSKAAERLYISSTAVAKQMDQLEHEIGLRLFRRTQRGSHLTEAGEEFYKEAKYLVNYSKETLERIRRMDQDGESRIRLGSSTLRSGRYFLNWLASQHAQPSEFQIQLVPFAEDNYQSFLDVGSRLGKEIDIIASPISQESPIPNCNMLPVIQERFCCAMSIYHRLARKKELTLTDLYGETLYVFDRRYTSEIAPIMDALRAHPDIHTASVPDYDFRIFNQCEQSKGILLSRESWSDVHPLMETVPVNWSFPAPYGLIYSARPSKTVKRFLEYVQSLI